MSAEVIVPRLTAIEIAELATHEHTIERGLKTFYEVGMALLAIRDQRLYRADYGRFEDYCRERWGMSHRHANRLVASAEVVINLGPIGPIPLSESQLRPLTDLSAEDQRRAWGIAQELAADHTRDGRPTAMLVDVAAAHVREPETMMISPVYEERAAQKMAVHYSSASPEWYTPPQIVAAVLDFFDAIDLDPCAEEGDPKTIPARVHFTAADDGLSRPWFGRVYMNPPYGDAIPPWIAKIDAAYRSREIEAGIALVPARTDTAWFAPLWSHTICFVRGRLKFSGEDSAPFPSALVYLGDEYTRFATSVRHLGAVVRGYERTH